MEKELTPKQQTSEAVRQAETILIMTGQKPSIDQVASTVALTAILRKYGKKVTAVISDEVPTSAKFLPTTNVERAMGGLRDFILRVDLANAEVDKLKYTIEEGKLNIQVTPFAGGFSQRDVSYAYGDYQFDLIIVLGVASYDRIDKVYAQNADMLRQIPLVNIDFHRINEQYGAVNLIEPTAASLAEILIALSESLQAGLIDEGIATTMLTGIYAATDRFTATHTTAKTMTVAAQMVAMGADQQKVVRNLYRSDKDKPDKGDRGGKKPVQTPAQPQQQSQSQPQNQAPARISSEPAVISAPIEPQELVTEPTPNPMPTVEPVAAPTTMRLSNAPRAEYQHQEELIRPTVSEPVVQQPVAAEPIAPAVQAPAPIAAVQSQIDGESVANEPQPTLDIEQPTASATPIRSQSIPQLEVEPEPVSDEEADALIAEDEAADAAETPSTKESAAASLEELLPPQHIELSPVEPEPLINDTSQPHLSGSNKPLPAKKTNPTNNPIFAQRLDEFEY